MARRKPVEGGAVAYSITLPKRESDFVNKLVAEEERTRSWIIAKIIKTFMLSGSSLISSASNKSLGTEIENDTPN